MRKKNLTRFWFEFSVQPYSNPYFGVTAYNHEDALEQIKQRVFPLVELPTLKHYIEDIDVSTLDAGHILPNMYPPNYRGIWYPKGFSEAF